MTCYLLHIMEDPDRDAYRDPDLRDVVGMMPKAFCAQCQPLKPLLSSESLKCMQRNAPCWKAADLICADEPTDAVREKIPGDAVDREEPGDLVD
jgi:hypothetical protein